MRAILKCFCCGLFTLILLQLFFSSDLTLCKAAETPSIATLRRAHSELRSASIHMQGEIRIYRSESVIPAATEQLPTEIELPLILKGTFWRSKERFRADYKSYKPRSQAAAESFHSVAFDEGKNFELSSGINPDGGMLRVYDADTPEAVSAMAFIKSSFYEPFDTLWSCNGTPYADLLQRPGIKFGPSNSTDSFGEYSLIVSEEGSSKVEFRLKSASNKFSFRYSYASDGEGKSLFSAERHVFLQEKEGALYPARVVDIVSMGTEGGGYTEVVMLDPKPLDTNSPIAERITSASFKDTGIGYQVYNFRNSEPEEVAERYERPSTFASDSSGSENRTFFLWVNGIVIFALLVVIGYKYRKRRKI